jgi:uncharacterized protein (DUF2252 family)
MMWGDGEPTIQLKLIKYTESSAPMERAALIPAAIDFWNNELHYWDRTTKYKKMKAGQYAFCRGTAPLYWYDFGEDDRLTQFGNEHTATWLSGDYHAYNAGTFDRNQVVYGLNDFDESVVADYQLDLWRLAISINLIAGENQNLSKEDLADVIDAMSTKYLERMRHFVTNTSAIKEKLTKFNAYGKLQDFLKIIEEKCTRDKMLDKWCPKDKDGRRRWDLSLEKLGSATAQEKEAILHATEKYWTILHEPVDPSNFHVLDISRRLLAGTGSLGNDRFYVLVRDKEAGVERILDVKHQPKPAPYSYISKEARETYDKHARNNDALRVAIAHGKLSVNPDAFAGWMKLFGKFYSVQERSPFKGSFPALTAEATKEFKKLKLDNKKHYEELAEQWAWVLATYHAYAKRAKNKAWNKTLWTLLTIKMIRLKR